MYDITLAELHIFEASFLSASRGGQENEYGVCEIRADSASDIGGGNILRRSARTSLYQSRRKI